jgi:hypothetical protein
MMKREDKATLPDADGTTAQNIVKTTGQSLKLGRRDRMSVALTAKLYW